MTLRSKHTNQYFSYDRKNHNASSNGSPPSTRTFEAPSEQGASRDDAINQFRIVSGISKDTRTGVQINSKVFLVNR